MRYLISTGSIVQILITSCMKKGIISLILSLSISIPFYAQHVGIGTTAPQAMLDINGDVVLRTGDIIIMDSLTLTLNVDTPGYSSYRLWLSGSYDTCIVVGLSPGVDGRKPDPSSAGGRRGQQARRHRHRPGSPQRLALPLLQRGH